LPGPTADLAVFDILLFTATSRIQTDLVDFAAIRTAYRRVGLGSAVSQRESLIQSIVSKAHRGTQRRGILGLAVAIGLSIILLAARVGAAPELSDPVQGVTSPSLHLATPVLYLIFAPVFTLWDGISMLSMGRLKGFLLGLALLYLAWRIVHAWWSKPRRRRGFWLGELGVLVISITLLAAFLVLGALWHRPMRSLAGVPPSDLVVDFHSHTNVSHDVRNTLMRGFDREANRRWHARAGFDAAFITDHNTMEGQGPKDQEAGTSDQKKHTVLCPGIEVSAWRAHIVLLGDSMPVDRSRFNGSLGALLTLLQVSDTSYAALSVASLPEYRRNHWGRLDTLVAAGLDGLEIVNAAPKANELTRPERDSVIALARAHNRFLVGVSDSHGWGATSMVWNLIRRPSEATGGMCQAVLRQLKTGFPAVRIIERHRLRPDDWWPMWLTPMGVTWETWRGMGWPLTISWLVWIWILAGWRRGRTAARLRADALGVNIAL
jgi:hypothetical protein